MVLKTEVRLRCPQMLLLCLKRDSQDGYASREKLFTWENLLTGSIHSLEPIYQAAMTDARRIAHRYPGVCPSSCSAAVVRNGALRLATASTLSSSRNAALPTGLAAAWLDWSQTQVDQLALGRQHPYTMASTSHCCARARPRALLTALTALARTHYADALYRADWDSGLPSPYFMSFNLQIDRVAAALAYSAVEISVHFPISIAEGNA
eukprot:3186681-Pleurochrysis_carterae.AAC.2